jgi:hypothetical protein
MTHNITTTLLISLIMLHACHNNNKHPSATISTQSIDIPTFNSDTAYYHIQQQTNYGPRVPNTPAHKSCGDYLITQLKQYGASIHTQEATLTAYNGTQLQARNIIATYNPNNPQRILLFAHWDTRPYADRDSNAHTQLQPIDGADDGASGTAVLLEIARQINQQAPRPGIDIILFDAEDYGPPSNQEHSSKLESWCLGSQFWARNPHKPNYRAQYGILLDLVGAQNATFLREYTSEQNAPQLLDKIWNIARELGYGKYFINQPGGDIIDDHKYVIAGRKIPCINIINYDTKTNEGFPTHWHTHNDNINIIQRETLKAVGQTILQFIYTLP